MYFVQIVVKKAANLGKIGIGCFSFEKVGGVNY